MRVLLVLLAACWSSSPQSQPRVTTPVATPQPTTSAPAPTEANEPAEEETALTSKRWQYATFFNRLKRKIGNEWDPVGVWTALPQVRRDSYGTQTRSTLVEISLSDQGDLIAIAMVQPSGVTELDVEAIRSVQASAPFGVPPPGLIVNGAIKFQFGFWFEIAAQTGSLKLQTAP